MQWLYTALTALLGAIGVRLHNRLDKLSETTVTRAELTGIQAQNREDRAALHLENRERLERIETKIDVQAMLSARLVHLEEELNRLRDWKHEKVDPYIPGAVDAIKQQLDRIELKVFNGNNHR